MSEQKNKNFRSSLVALSLMAISVVGGALFSLGSQDTPFFFVTACIAVLVGLWLFRSEHTLVRVSSWIGYAFLGLFTFAAWATISSLWAYTPGHAAMHGLGWALIALLGVLGYVYATQIPQGSLMYVRTVVAVSAIVAAYSVYLFVSSNGTLNRLFFPFGLPNVNGGFFILPFFLSFGLVLYEQLAFQCNAKRYTVWVSCLVLIGTALVLTFSRASWAAVAFGFIFFSFLISFRLIKRMGFVTVLLCCGTAVVIGALSFLAYRPHQVSTGDGQWSSFLIRSGESKSINGYVLRASYLQDAFSYIPDYLPFGAGGRSYEQVMRLFKEDLNGWTTDPHNAPVRFLLEYGLFSFGLYFFVGVLFVYLFLDIWHRRFHISTESPQLVFLASVFVGLAASLAHSVVDVDWSYLQLVALFILTLCVVVGGVQSSNKKGAYIIVPQMIVSFRGLVIVTIILSTAVIITVFSLIITRHTRSLAVAGGFSGNTLVPKVFYWADPRIGVERGVAFMNRIMKGDLSLIPRAKREFILAQEYSPFDSAAYFYLAELAYMQGDVFSSIELYKKSIEYNKAGSYVERSRLLSLFVTRHMVEEGINLAKESVAIYEPYTQSPFFMGDPAKDDIRVHLSYWKNIITTAPTSR